MSQLFLGSMCHTDYMELLKTGKFKAEKAANGKIYVDFKFWINDEKDEYGNDASVQPNAKEEFRAEKPKSYIGNARRNEKAEPVQATTEDFKDEDDLPF